MGCLPWPSQGGCYLSCGQIDMRESHIRFILLLETLDQFLSTQHIGGGMRLLPSLPTLSSLPFKWPLRSRFGINGEMKPPSTSPTWNIIWHKQKAQRKVAFLWPVIHEAMTLKWMGLENLDKLDKIMWSQWSACFVVALWLHKLALWCEHYVAILW